MGYHLQLTPLTGLIKNMALLFLGLIALRAKFIQTKMGHEFKLGTVICLLSIFLVLIISPLNFSVVSTYRSDAFISELGFSDEQVGSSASQGTLLVALLSTDCEHCVDFGKRLHQEGVKDSDITVLVCLLGEVGDEIMFFSEIGGVIPHIMLSPEKFFSYVDESPPKIFVFDDGLLKGEFETENYHELQEKRDQMKVSERKWRGNGGISQLNVSREFRGHMTKYISP